MAGRHLHRFAAADWAVQGPAPTRQVDTCTDSLPRLIDQLNSRVFIFQQSSESGARVFANLLFEFLSD